MINEELAQQLFVGLMLLRFKFLGKNIYAPKLAKSTVSESLYHISEFGYINFNLLEIWPKINYKIVKNSSNKASLLNGHTMQLPAHTAYRFQFLDVTFFELSQIFYV